MSDHAALFHPNAAGGIWRRFTTNRKIDHDLWIKARTAGQFVGECRQCGDYLIPAKPEETTPGLYSYTAQCRNGQCAAELVAPSGRVQRRHARPGGTG